MTGACDDAGSAGRWERRRMTTHATYRRLTPGRIIALAAIAVVAVALGLIWSARDGDDVSVPAGARAGQLTLKPCTYGSEGGDLNADCGTLVVPENRQDPGSRLIALPVKRIHARSADPDEPIFRLEGGPGITNMDFPYAHRYTERHDLVLVGYRGVDGSSVLDCPEVEDARRRSGDLLGERSLRASGDAFGDCARRLRDDGVDLGGYSMSERVDDLEAARRALDYERVALLSESAGTRTAMIYAWRYPKSIRRSVMIGVNPPGHFLAEEAATTAQLTRFSSLCAHDADCPQRNEDLAASMRSTLDDMPRRWGPLPIRRGNVQLASFFGLMEASSEAAPLSAPMTFDAWRAASEGDAGGLWFQSLAADLLFPRAMVWGDTASVARADVAAAARHFGAAAPGDSPFGDAVNQFQWAGGRMLREWPANTDDDAYARIRTSQVETLLVSGTLDGATPLGSATRDLLRHLPNGHQVVLEGFGHTTDFWTQQEAAGTRLINTYLDRGRVDDSLYTRQRVDFTPEVRESDLAKGIAGTMVLFAIVTVTSLLWMARRARKGRRFGVKASAFQRSIHAAVLGLGGWFLAALVAMVVLPDTPIDAELLAVLSIGVPVGLAIHWASVDGGWARGTRLAACATALAGAVLGAWLGFEAPGSALGLLTAIPGAVAAANLAVIVRDVVPAPSARREPTPAVGEAPARAVA